jgi:hypothetical protein
MFLTRELGFEHIGSTKEVEGPRYRVFLVYDTRGKQRLNVSSAYVERYQEMVDLIADGVARSRNHNR